jgi:hypothetical protein
MLALEADFPLARSRRRGRWRRGRRRLLLLELLQALLNAAQFLLQLLHFRQRSLGET